MGAELIAWSFTSGWASGINAYAVVFAMGLIGRFGDISAIPGVLTRADVLIVAGILTLIDFFADKIPYVDSAWDAVHTFIRPLIAATVGYLLVAGNEGASLDAAFTAATGGITALMSHFVKSGVRVAVNTSPEPASNAVVSTAEDVAVAGIMTVAYHDPWIAAVGAGVLLLVTAVLAVFLIRRLRTLKQRYDEWGLRATARLWGARNEDRAVTS